MEVSHPDRVVFPEAGITKGEVVAYYEQVADRMLPHLEGRPLTLERYPRGIGAPGFMQKNAAAHFPRSIERVEIPKQGGTTTYAVVSQAPDIVYLANQGTISFHAWSSRLPDLGKPDRLIIDLDPTAGDVARVREAASITGEVMAALGLPSLPVATGSKGYHVVAPIAPGIDGERVAAATHGLALWLAALHPKLMTAEFRKENRSGRVFVDWLRNGPGQTSVVPWSLRAGPEAPASVPLEWDEVDGVAPNEYGLRSISVRLDRSDPLAALASSPADGAAAIGKLERALAAADIHPERFDRFRS